MADTKGSDLTQVPSIADSDGIYVVFDLDGIPISRIILTADLRADIVLPLPFTMRNLLINASGRVNQREYVSTTATTGTNEFTLDRWRVLVSGQNLTFSASGNFIVMTAPAGGLGQVIEGVNVDGGTYVITWTGTATCTVGGVARTSGETFTLVANTNVDIVFSGGTVSKPQLEKGSDQTDFENRLFHNELIAGQRYFFPKPAYRVLLADAGGTGPNIGPYLSFPVQMRTEPTVSQSDLQFQVNTGDVEFILWSVSRTGVQPYFNATSASGAAGLQTDFTFDAELTS